jgi:hypothetical protein
MGREQKPVDCRYHLLSGNLGRLIKHTCKLACQKIGGENEEIYDNLFRSGFNIGLPRATTFSASRS